MLEAKYSILLLYQNQSISLILLITLPCRTAGRICTAKGELVELKLFHNERSHYPI